MAWHYCAWIEGPALRAVLGGVMARFLRARFTGGSLRLEPRWLQRSVAPLRACRRFFRSSVSSTKMGWSQRLRYEFVVTRTCTNVSVLCIGPKLRLRPVAVGPSLPLF